MRPEAEQDLIPDGEKVFVRVAGCDRFVSQFAPDVCIRYSLQMEVTDGPYRGRRLVRDLWHSSGGFRQLTADSLALGVAHPEELCCRLQREYRVRVCVGIGVDGGQRRNTVVWIEDPARVKKPVLPHRQQLPQPLSEPRQPVTEPEMDAALAAAF